MQKELEQRERGHERRDIMLAAEALQFFRETAINGKRTARSPEGLNMRARVIQRKLEMVDR